MIKIKIDLERALADMFDKTIEEMCPEYKARMICENVSIDGIQPEVYDGCVSLDVKGRGIPFVCADWKGDEFDIYDERVFTEIARDGHKLRGRSGGHLCLTSMPDGFVLPSTEAFENVIDEFIEMNSIKVSLSSVLNGDEDAIIGALEDAGFYEYFQNNISNMIDFTLFETIIQKASDKVRLFETDEYWSEPIPAEVTDDSGENAECETRAKEVRTPADTENVIPYVKMKDENAFALVDDGSVKTTTATRIDKIDDEMHITLKSGSLFVFPMSSVNYYKMGAKL